MAGDVEIEAAFLEVRIGGAVHNIRWPVNQSLVDAMHANDIDAPFSCKSGKCAACACQLISGQVNMEQNEILTEDDLADGYILGCQSRPVTENIRIEF